MEFKEGHSEDMKVTSKLSQGKNILEVLGGKEPSILKEAKEAHILLYKKWGERHWKKLLIFHPEFNGQILKFPNL